MFFSLLYHKCNYINLVVGTDGYEKDEDDEIVRDIATSILAFGVAINVAYEN